MKKVIYSASVLLAVEKLKAKNDIVKFSNTSKLGVKAWGLQALNTCPGSTNEKGELVAACSGCYAVGGSYRFNNVRAARLYNQTAWQNEFFIDQFVIKLQNDRFFRWFDSGDMYSIGLAEKIYQIMQKTPHVQHWLPTRMYKFAKFMPILEKMQALPNVVVRLSSDSIQGEKVKNAAIDTNSTIVPHDAETLDSSIFLCPASTQNDECQDCKACYSKEVKTIAYVGHGASMKKQQNLIKTVTV